MPVRSSSLVVNLHVSKHSMRIQCANGAVALGGRAAADPPSARRSSMPGYQPKSTSLYSRVKSEPSRATSSLAAETSELDCKQLELDRTTFEKDKAFFEAYKRAIDLTLAETRPADFATKFIDAVNETASRYDDHARHCKNHNISGDKLSERDWDTLRNELNTFLESTPLDQLSDADLRHAGAAVTKLQTGGCEAIKAEGMRRVFLSNMDQLTQSDSVFSINSSVTSAVDSLNTYIEYCDKHNIAPHPETSEFLWKFQKDVDKALVAEKFSTEDISDVDMHMLSKALLQLGVEGEGSRKVFSEDARRINASVAAMNASERCPKEVVQTLVKLQGAQYSGLRRLTVSILSKFFRPTGLKKRLSELGEKELDDLGRLCAAHNHKAGTEQVIKTSSQRAGKQIKLAKRTDELVSLLSDDSRSDQEWAKMSLEDVKNLLVMMKGTRNMNGIFLVSRELAFRANPDPEKTRRPVKAEFLEVDRDTRQVGGGSMVVASPVSKIAPLSELAEALSRYRP